MIKLDPIIAVKNVNASAHWYQSVFGCGRKHGGEEFAVLVGLKNEPMICLHKWGEHDHPTMQHQEVQPGNGLILYFKTDDIHRIRENVYKMSYTLEEDIHLNPNSGKEEFSLRDPDGYFLTVSAYHRYEG